MDLVLSDARHDIVIEDGDFKLTETTCESLRQRLIIKLLTFAGEWYLNLNEGIPYYQSILGKPRAKETIDIIFKNAILNTPDVLEITEFVSEITKDRFYKLKFKVRSICTNEIIPVELDTRKATGAYEEFDEFDYNDLWWDASNRLWNTANVVFPEFIGDDVWQV